MRSSSFSFFTLLYYVFKQLFHYPINFHEKTISNSFSQTQFPTSPTNLLHLVPTGKVLENNVLLLLVLNKITINVQT